MASFSTLRNILISDICWHSLNFSLWCINCGLCPTHLPLLNKALSLAKTDVKLGAAALDHLREWQNANTELAKDTLQSQYCYVNQIRYSDAQMFARKSIGVLSFWKTT